MNYVKKNLGKRRSCGFCSQLFFPKDHNPVCPDCLKKRKRRINKENGKINKRSDGDRRKEKDSDN